MTSNHQSKSNDKGRGHQRGRLEDLIERGTRRRLEILGYLRKLEVLGLLDSAVAEHRRARLGRSFHNGLTS